MLNYEELKNEVSRRHNKQLDVNDPIFMTVTLHDLLFAKYVEQFQTLSEQQQAQADAKLVERINQSLQMNANQLDSALAAFQKILDSAGSSLEAQLDRITHVQAEKVQQEFQTGVSKVRNALDFLHFGFLILVAALSFILGVLFKIFILH